MATHSSILAWRIPWTEEPGGLVHRAAKSQTRLKRLSMHACQWSGLQAFTAEGSSSIPGLGTPVQRA